MNIESEIDQRMLRFYQKTKGSLSSIPPPKPFLVTIVESKTDSVPFSSPADVPAKKEKTPSTLAPPKANPTEITPNEGPTRGGQSVVIKGTDFIQGAKVIFDTSVATSVVVVDDKKITCVTPAHEQNKVKLTVQNIPDNTTFEGTLANAYTYVAPPTITLVTPAFGPTSGGIAVSIYGTNLAYVTSVNWGGANIPFNYGGGDSISVTAPAHSAGFITIILTNKFGDTGGKANAFKYVAPPDHYEWFTVIGHTPTDTGFDNGASKRLAIVAKNGAVTNTEYQGYVNVSSILVGPAVSFNDSPNMDNPIPVVNGTALFDVQAFCIDHGASTVQSLQFHAQDTQYAVGGDSPIYGVSNLPDLAVGGRRTGPGGGGGGVNVIGWVMGYATAYGAGGAYTFGPWNWEGITLTNRQVTIQMKDSSGFVIDFNGPGTLTHVFITQPTSFNGFAISHAATVNFIHGEANVNVSVNYTGGSPYQSYAYFYLKASANTINGQSPQCVILNHL